MNVFLFDTGKLFTPSQANKELSSVSLYAGTGGGSKD